MTMRLRLQHSNLTHGPHPVVQLWLLRLLVPLGAHREFVSEHGFSDDGLAEWLGLAMLDESESKEFDSKAALAKLRRRYKAAERQRGDAPVPACLRANMTRLTQLVTLSDTESRLLEFAVMLHNERMLDEVADWLGNLSSESVVRTLSILLELPENDTRAALKPQGTLARSGLLTLDRSGNGTLRSKLELLSCNFADYICSSETDPVSLLRDTVVRSTAPKLALSDYEHVGAFLAVLRPYLKQSLATRRTGVNILLYGAPGTGKSELARTLAHELDCELFDIASEDEDGDAITGEARLRAYRAAQGFFANQRVVLLFDEVEDVFDDGQRFFGPKSTWQTRKGWLNRMLESNPVPAMWLSNSVWGLDPAYVRRFDLVVELPVPPKRQRERILREACADLIDTDRITRIAESDALSPAVVARSAAVARSIRVEVGDAGAAKALELMIDSTLDAQGHRPIRHGDANRLPNVYDPAFVHADADLAELAGGLLQAGSGRLCLYGPPGTGKTAFARWLSEQLGLALRVKRASDLMSPWVGENERNIAAAFREAEQDKALLLIDEVDSFLQDRRSAQRGWEVSLVNEMLTQMEAFSGVFIASTNLMQGLDQAALRRFDLKVKFGFLRSRQASDLFQRYCKELALGAPAPDVSAKLERLINLTPGDFAAVARQHRFRPLRAPDDLLFALQAECMVKDGPSAPIGF